MALVVDPMTDPAAGAMAVRQEMLTLARVVKCYLGNVRALVEGFGHAWGVQFRRGRLTNEEEQLAQRLEREKYANPAWTSSLG